MCCADIRVSGSLLFSRDCKGQNLVLCSHITWWVLCPVLCCVSMPSSTLLLLLCYVEGMNDGVGFFLLFLCPLSVPLILCSCFSCRWVMPGLHSAYKLLSQHPIMDVSFSSASEALALLAFFQLTARH